MVSGGVPRKGFHGRAALGIASRTRMLRGGEGETRYRTSTIGHVPKRTLRRAKAQIKRWIKKGMPGPEMDFSARQFLARGLVKNGVVTAVSKSYLVRRLLYSLEIENPGLFSMAQLREKARLNPKGEAPDARAARHQQMIATLLAKRRSQPKEKTALQKRDAMLAAEAGLRSWVSNGMPRNEGLDFSTMHSLARSLIKHGIVPGVTDPDIARQALLSLAIQNRAFLLQVLRAKAGHAPAKAPAAAKGLSPRKRALMQKTKARN